MRLRVLAALAILAVPSFAVGQVGAPRVTEVLVLASAATALTKSPGRGAIEVQNLGPNAIFCAFTSATAVLNKARKIATGETWAPDLKDPVNIYCIAASADQVAGAATIVSEIE